MIVCAIVVVVVNAMTTVETDRQREWPTADRVGDG